MSLCVGLLAASSKGALVCAEAVPNICRAKPISRLLTCVCVDVVVKVFAELLLAGRSLPVGFGDALI